MLYSVNFSVDTWYPNIEADNEREAIEKAFELFWQCEPDIFVEEQEEEI